MVRNGLRAVVIMFLAISLMMFGTSAAQADVTGAPSADSGIDGITLNPDSTLPQISTMFDTRVPAVKVQYNLDTDPIHQCDLCPPPTGVESGDSGGTSASAEVCYDFWRAWGVYNHAKQMMYAWKLYLNWCSKGGKITKLNLGSDSNDRGGACARYGGFFQYMGCSGWRGVMNQETLRIGDDWHFRQYVGSTFENRYPSLEATLYADGTITGTVYWA